MPKKLKIVIAAMLIMTCLVAVIHISQQENIACMVIKTGEIEIAVDFADLNKTEFSGELINGKGDVSFPQLHRSPFAGFAERKGRCCF